MENASSTLSERLAGRVVLVHLEADGKLVFHVALADDKIVPFILPGDKPPQIFGAVVSMVSSALNTTTLVTVHYIKGPGGAQPTSIEMLAR